MHGGSSADRQPAATPSEPNAAARETEETEQQETGVERAWYPLQYKDDEPHLAEDAFLEIESQRLRLVRDDHREVFERFFADAREVLVRLHRSVRSHGAQLVMVVIPDEYQVNAELRRQIEERFEIDPETLDLTLPQRRLADFCREEGLACLDLLPLLEAAPERTYRPRDTHWNAAGNRLAAEAIADFLAQNPQRVRGIRRGRRW